MKPRKIKETREPVFVTLRPSERAAVAKLAEAEERTLSSQIRVMVLDALKKKSRAINPAP